MTPSSDIPTVSGIYRITCIVTGKFYIGSAVNLRRRHQEHFRDLHRNAHYNRKLQRAWNKHGKEAFVFDILEFVLILEFLTVREQYWFDKLSPFGDKGFNIAPTAGSVLGMKSSPETIEKLRISHLGQPGYWLGKKRSPETVAKANAKKIGKPSPRRPGYTHSPEHREKLRLANLGKKYGEGTRRKLSEMRMGRKMSPESIEKTRQSNLGRKNTPEAIEGMREAHKGEMKALIVTDPNGIEHTVYGVRQFCKEHHLDRRSIQRVAQGKLRQHKGWRARYADMS